MSCFILKAVFSVHQVQSPHSIQKIAILLQLDKIRSKASQQKALPACAKLISQRTRADSR